MTGIIEQFIRENWEQVSPNCEIPKKVKVMKLNGQASEISSLNFCIFCDKETEPRYFLKMNRAPFNFSKIEEEYNNLKYFVQLLPEGIIDTIPNPLFLAKLDDQTMIMGEYFLRGRKADIARGEDLKTLFSFALGWLKEFHSITKSRVCYFSCLEFEGRLKGFLQESGVDKDTYRNAFYLIDMANKFEGYALPITGRQGNFDFDNILIHDNGVYVLDWEDSRRDASSLLDLEFLIFHTALYCDNRTFSVKNFADFLAVGSKTYKLADCLIDEYCKAMGLEKNIFYLKSISDTLDIFQNHYGMHMHIPLQDKDFIKALINLAARELS